MNSREKAPDPSPDKREPSEGEHTDVREVSSEARAVAAWRQWLKSMATDAESVLAAAIAYRDLNDEGRERWLESLEADAPDVGVPKVALYAPLIAVEQDPVRRSRLLQALEGLTGDDEYSAARPSGQTQALTGHDVAGTPVCVLILPLYLDFVQVLACGYDQRGFTWVRHDPILLHVQAPRPGALVQGARLEATPLKPAIDNLAAAVLAHRRSGRPMPEALGVIADLLDPSELANV